jgi:Ser/Thr protein kinase RdoA (MazF antagonist)
MASELSDEAKAAYLQRHIERQYNVSVVETQRLERGVYTLALADERRWVSRVFPERRPLAQVEADAEALRRLAEIGVPAERLANAQPVTTLQSRVILVTRYIVGARPEKSLELLREYGALLGRLHALPDEISAGLPAAGALHHYVPQGGGPAAQLAAASYWLDSVADKVPSDRQRLYDNLRAQLAAADPCRDLPQAFIHPDPVLANLLQPESGELTLIDWSGAGRGPRLAGLALLLWVGGLNEGGWSPEYVDAIVAGYREHIQPTGDELTRLADVMRIRPLVHACHIYRRALNGGKSPDGNEWWWPDDLLVAAISNHARAAFER